PGNGLGGYGWQEDSSCHSKAAYIENFHQIFASQQELYPDFKLDGYFTDYPAPATVLLRRTKNLMPAMLMYDYKKGRVIVSSLYSDWGYTNGQASQDEIRLIQDLVRWAKKAQDLAEYTKEKQFSGAVEVYRDFNAIEMILKSPDGAILEKKISSEPVYEPGVAPARTGIYSVDYILYNSSGEAIQPQTEGFYFCFSQPPEGSVSNPDFNFDITSDRETYVSGAEAVLTLHLKNNTPQDALVQCKAKLNHHDIDFTESFIVPAGGITAFDKKITVNATDLMKADFYSGENYFLGHAERGVKVVQPSVETNIATDKMQYTPGQTISIDATTINNSKTMFELLLVLSIADSGRELYYNTRLVELGEGGTDSWQESFKIPEDAERGMYKIRLDVFSNSRLVGSSSATADIPGPLVYAGVGDILSIEMEKLLYARGEPILANAIINNHGEKIDSAALDIRVLTDVDAGYLTGMVKDGEVMPVRGALVNNVYTNEKGAYELKRLKTGRLTLNITAHGYDRMTEEVEIIAGANSLDLVLASTEYGNFSGTLPDSIGSELSLQPVDSASSESGARNAVVSGQGNFEFRHVPVGIYGLEIQPESFTETIQIEKGENVLGSLHSLEEYYSFSKQGAGGQAVNEHSYQEIQETEPNDDFLSADEVDPAANVHGKIYDIGDEDYFKLTVDAPSLLTITVKNVELDFSPYIIVYDIAGKWLGSTASLSGEELGYTIELAKAGTYYLQLKDRYNSFSSQQEYLLNINSISGSDQYEPNSDFDNAKAVDLRKEIYCTMFPDGDEDYFAIDIADKGEFYMRFEDVPYGLRPSVKLYDHSGRLAAQKGGSSGEEITLQAEIEEACRYYILIKDWYSNFSSMETYSFQAFFVNTLDEYEPNNSREEAVTLESGKDYFATIATKGDNDFYRLSIPDSGRVIINLTDTPPNIRPYIKLYQWTNSSWIDSTAGAAGEDLTMEFNVDKPSNYFMQIQDRYNSESSLSKYRTSFTFIPDDEYLPDSIEVFHQTVQLSAIVKKEELGIEIPGIEDAGKFYLQAALNSSDPQKNSQAIERFYVGDTIPGPVLFSQIEVLCLDNNAIYSAGEKAGFRFKAVNKGTAGGACEIQFRFRDLFNQAWSEFIEAEKESDIQFDFLLPVDLEEGAYEAEYLFGGKQYQASFRVLSVKLEVEASFRENTFTINLTNTGSIANADLFIEVSCGGFKEARDVVLRDKTELIFEIQETDSQDKIYYGVYFSSGKALYLDSFLLDGGEEPQPSLKIVKAECDKDIYMDGDFVNIEWRLVSQGISSARLAADLFYPDSGSIKIIDEYISVTEGMNILEKEIKPDLKIPGLYRIIYRLICGDSVEVQGSIFFDAGEEVRVELYIAGDEYTQGEKIDFTARCFASSEVEGRLKLVVDEKSSETVNINLNGYEDFTFNAKEDEPGEHTAYLSLSYGDKTVNSGREKFKIIKQPEPNHSPVLLTIGEKIVMIGEALEFSIEAADIDGDIITYSVKDLPRGAVFGKRKFFWMPGVDQAGEYFVSF
ncbi:MAG: hypothetical protein KKB46_00185, partial [Candidatus Omnitrophica bacterium]|nr:hypothetical protein [Candidatus Omnitrophota bacterium]